jgi:hypothetical protein
MHAGAAAGASHVRRLFGALTKKMAAVAAGQPEISCSS